VTGEYDEEVQAVIVKVHGGAGLATMCSDSSGNTAAARSGRPMGQKPRADYVDTERGSRVDGERRVSSMHILPSWARLAGA